MTELLTGADVADLALDFAVEPAAIEAVKEVESSGSGFDHQGRPKILFEGHIFWKRLKHYGASPKEILLEDPASASVLYRRWVDRPEEAYRVAQYHRLSLARSLDPHIHSAAAFESCSWGMFQVMGYHWEALGYASVGDFVSLMHRSERDHLDAFMRYVRANRLLEPLRHHQWDVFARGYNGPGFRKNRYDEKLADAYARHTVQ